MLKAEMRAQRNTMRITEVLKKICDSLLGRHSGCTDRLAVGKTHEHAAARSSQLRSARWGITDDIWILATTTEDGHTLKDIATSPMFSCVHLCVSWHRQDTCRVAQKLQGVHTCSARDWFTSHPAASSSDHLLLEDKMKRRTGDAMLRRDLTRTQ